MKQIILALMLAVAGIGAAVAANPIREGNILSSTYKCNFLGADNKQ